MTNQIHPLAKWLKEHNHNQSWMADQVGVTRAAVSKWLNGHARPSADTAHAIQKITRGDVTVAEVTNPSLVGRHGVLRPTHEAAA